MAIKTVVLFSANNGTNGTELWVTDGTAGGTRMLKDIVGGGTGSSPSPAIASGGKALFVASTADGRELWVTNGTEAGTHLVKDIFPGFESSNPGGFAALGGRFVFSAMADDGLRDVWITDGTEEGTSRLTAVGVSPDQMAAVGGQVVFKAYSDARGGELWVTDGTAFGTWMLKDIFPGDTGSNPHTFMEVGGKLLFTALEDDFVPRVWVTDGTADGTARLADVTMQAASDGDAGFARLDDGRLLFAGSNAATGAELWVTDGTAGGTGVLDVEPGAGGISPTNLVSLGDRVLFSASSMGQQQLWVSDGTVDGTHAVKASNGDAVPFPRFMAAVNGRAVFVTGDFAGTRLWASDGTDAGTVQLDATLSPGYDPMPPYFTRLGDKLLFLARDASGEYELWATDGTAAGTAQVVDIRDGNAGGFPLYMTPFSYEVPAVASIARQTPSDAATDADSVTFRVTFDGPVLNVDKTDFTVTGTTATVQTVTAAGGNAYDVTVSGGDLATLNGTVTLGFAAGQDIANADGHALESTTPTGTDDNSYLLDQTPPAVASLVRQTPADATTRADTLTWRVTFSEAVSGIGTADFAVTGTTATVQTVTPAGGNAYDVTVSGGDLATLNGTVTLGFAAGQDIVDAAGKALSSTTPTGTHTPTYAVDNAKPTLTSITRQTPEGEQTNAASVVFRVTFSEALDDSRIGTADFSGDPSGAMPTAVDKVADGVYDVTMTGGRLAGGNGEVKLTFSGAEDLTDLAGNSFDDQTPTGPYETYTADNTAPNVNAFTGAEARTYYSGEAIEFTVSFGEAVTVTGTPRLALTLDTGGTVYADYVSGSGSGTLTFRHTVGDGEFKDEDGVQLGAAVDLNGGTIADMAGNPLDSALLPGAGFQPGVLVDGTAPKVASVTAATADGTYKAGDTVTIAVAFNKPVAVTGVPSLVLNTGHAATYTGGTGTAALTFTYTVQPGDTAADLDYAGTGALALAGGTIADNTTGTAALVTLPAPGAAGSLGNAAAIVLDTTPPPTPAIATVAGDGIVNAAEAGAGLTLTGTAGGDAVGVSIMLGGQTHAAVLTAGTWTCTLGPAALAAPGQGAQALTVTARDAAGNTAATTTTIVVDTAVAAPAIAADAGPAGAAAATWTVTFAEGVTGVDAADFLLTATGTAAGTIGTVTAVDAKTYRVAVNDLAGAGTLRLDLKAAGTSIADAAGNGLSAGAASGTVHTVDHVAPAFTGATVVGGTLRLAYGEALDGASDPAGSAFTVLVDGQPVTVVAADAAGTGVTLTLAQAVTNGQTVTVAYAPPGTGPVRDAAGNNAAAFGATPVVNATPLPGPTTPTDPGTPTDPNAPVTEVIGGVPVETKTETDATGAPIRVVTVPTVPATRPDGTPTGSIEVPLIKGADGSPLLEAGVPAGVGLRVEGGSAAPQTPQQAQADLGKALSAHGGEDGMAEAGQSFLDGLPAGTSVILRTVIPSVPAGTTEAPAQPIVISAPAGGTGTQEVLVLDLRGLPPGTVIELQNVEFAVIVGDARVTGGAGSQTAVGGGGKQYIVLGADDDVLHGGAGDDVVGSQGGNDRIFGDDGNDRLFGGTGDDTIDGGAGFDVVRFNGKASDFAITHNTDGSVTVRDTRKYAGVTVGEGTDTLTDVELLRFDDGARPATRSGPFDEAFYLAHNADVAAAVTSGLLVSGEQHFALFGATEGRDPNALFSTAWYLTQNPDVAAAVKAGLTTAWDHYDAFGWTEGRNASVWFDTTDYLAHNPDVAAAGVNPLVHLLTFGLGEGRLAWANDNTLWG